MRWSERQTKSFQKRVLERARGDGSLGELFWYVVMSKSGYSYAVAAPRKAVPLISVGDDPDESRHYAEMMLELFRSANRGADLSVEIGVREALVGLEWYEFGDAADWDIICPGCGAIGTDCVCSCVVKEVCIEEDVAP